MSKHGSKIKFKDSHTEYGTPKQSKRNDKDRKAGNNSGVEDDKKGGHVSRMKKKSEESEWEDEKEKYDSIGSSLTREEENYFAGSRLKKGGKDGVDKSRVKKEEKNGMVREERSEKKIHNKEKESQSRLKREEKKNEEKKRGKKSLKEKEKVSDNNIEKKAGLKKKVLELSIGSGRKKKERKEEKEEKEKEEEDEKKEQEEERGEEAEEKDEEEKEKDKKKEREDGDGDLNRGQVGTKKNERGLLLSQLNALMALWFSLIAFSLSASRLGPLEEWLDMTVATATVAFCCLSICVLANSLMLITNYNNRWFVS